MKVQQESSINASASRNSAPGKLLPFFAVFLILACQGSFLPAQDPPVEAAAGDTKEQQVERLTAAVAQAQVQIEAQRQQLIELQQQLGVLRLQMAEEKTAAPSASAASAASAAVSPDAKASLDEIRERQAIDESQIATHDVTKVETQSKYPLSVTGLLLFNAFVNTRQVDVSAAPSYALAGPGSTGLSLRQTVLGLDARGPLLFGATSHGDLRVDFFANGAQSAYAAGILRLRTLHAGLNWRNTDAFAELDRSILEPYAPSSLVAIAQPELAWAGNLWSWNPQVGVSHQFALTDSSRLKAQTALIDTSDPQMTSIASVASTVTQTERSRWPGTEARIAFLHGDNAAGPEIGAGGYFSPHRTPDGDRFDAWAGTMDVRIPFTRHFEMIGNAYRGASLAGLGAGGNVNYFYQYTYWGQEVRALDDVGGWAQFKARAGERVDFNTGWGADNPFADEVRAAYQTLGNSYQELARNRSFFSNVIYSPSAYLLFSLEYKRLWTNYATGPAHLSDAIGIGAGYKF
jgi:hypothetical protein